ncbi:hypothetical protein MSG28_014219 [Choristoneura fumiferana]|uniref:Uncharacterized protein n=1 Tax=Choristoneura fumiferana TaxID=7141 RepID=A0ACC0JGE4_CHOFU|nr:hypothetical protein MSG28_014219 [Choristoneura fumiferana]
MGIFLSLLIFLSVAGNILVCIAIYTDRGLRRIGNLFLASLAIADMLVASAVMTFAGVNDLLGYGRWVTRRVAVVTIAMIWLLASLVSFLPISLGLHRPHEEATATQKPPRYPTCALVLTPTYAVVSSCISFILPCIVMISIYCRLYCYAQKHVKSIRAVTRTVQLPDNRTKSVRTRVHTHVQSSPYHVSDHKAAITVGIIMGVFLLCWVPFFCVNIVAAFCKTCIPDLAFKILTWLGYSNSAFNPIIYSIFNTEFREAFKKILTSRYPLCCGYQSVRANTPTRNENFVTDYGTKTLVVRRSGSLGLSGVDPTPRSSAESVRPLRDHHI